MCYNIIRTVTNSDSNRKKVRKDKTVKTNKINVIVNLPMTQKKEKTVYAGTEGLPSSDKERIYAVNSYLEETLRPEDDVKIILIAKQTEFTNEKEIVETFTEEFREINHVGCKAETVVIRSEFVETSKVHEALMAELVSDIDDGARLITDITFGPKDLPLIMFAVLAFAENYLQCTIEHILYGQAIFSDNNTIEKTYLCDMGPLYSLSSLTSSIRFRSPDEARKMLNSIISFQREEQ